MLDYMIRNARVPGAANGGAVDIGFAKGKIAAIEPKLVADSPSYDAQGCLCCGGLVETHIHLDKSRIIERCSFAFMKQHENQFDPVMGKLWEQGVQLNTFLRKGRAGDGKQHLSLEQSDRFDRTARRQVPEFLDARQVPSP